MLITEILGYKICPQNPLTKKTSTCISVDWFCFFLFLLGGGEKKKTFNEWLWLKILCWIIKGRFPTLPLKLLHVPATITEINTFPIVYFLACIILFSKTNQQIGIQTHETSFIDTLMRATVQFSSTIILSPPPPVLPVYQEGGIISQLILCANI